MQYVSNSAQSGRSMIEAIGYISVMIMISVAAAAAVTSGYYKYRLSRITQQVTDIQKVVSQRWVASADYSGVKWEILVNEKIIPWELRSGSNTDKGKHAFSGDVTIGSSDSDEAYYIKFEGLPPDACTELGLKIWVINDGSDLDALQINGKTWCWGASVTDACKNGQDYSLPVSTSDVSAVCKSDWTNTITWYFN